MTSRRSSKQCEYLKPRLPLLADEDQASTSIGPPREAPAVAKTPSRWAVRLLWICTFGVIAAVLVPLAIMVYRAQETTKQASCMCHFTGLRVLCRIYANEAPGGAWPPLSSTEGRFMFDVDTMYPEYLQDKALLLCPSLYDRHARREMPPEQAIDDHSYYYLGYMLTTEDEGLAFLECYPKFIAEGADFSHDLPAPPGRGSFGGDVFLHFRNELCEDETLPLEKVPVLFEGAVVEGEFPVFHHREPGGNVIYLNRTGRSVDFVPYPGKFPMTPEFLEAIAKLDK